LDKGLHVLCEKPLALTAQQAREMAEKAESMGVKHMTYFTLRWQPYARYLAHLIEEGYLGRFYHGQFRYWGNYGRSPGYQWKWDEKRGLGILGDLGSHMIDSARWYLGEIGAVSAQLSNFVERTHADGRSILPTNDSALLNLKFQNGGQGMIHVSAVAHLGNRGMEQQVLLHGEDGTLELEFSFSGHSILRGALKDEAEIKELTIPEEFLQGVNWDAPIISHWQHVFTHHAAGGRAFIDAIINDLPISPNFFDGWQTHRVVEAAFESDRLGTWVSLAKGQA
jgi:predicted dehydrogenase